MTKDNKLTLIVIRNSNSLLYNKYNSI